MRLITMNFACMWYKTLKIQALKKFVSNNPIPMCLRAHETSKWRRKLEILYKSLEIFTK